MASINFDDILLFAIQIEKNGREFYETHAKKFEGNLGQLFSYLAEEEVQHEAFFSDLLKKFPLSEEGEYNEEYFSYINSFVDNLLINAPANEKLVNQITQPIEAIDFAIQMELNSIVFYAELSPSQEK